MQGVHVRRREKVHQTRKKKTTKIESARWVEYTVQGKEAQQDVEEEEKVHQPAQKINERTIESTRWVDLV